MTTQHYKEQFLNRHLGIREQNLPDMLNTVGVKTIEQLIDETIPSSIRTTKPLDISTRKSEKQFLSTLRKYKKENKVFNSFIGMGYYGTSLPTVIQRNILENPNWYTQYTPYQAEISQGRLEALLNYQTLVCELTSLPIANASLLDEATAAAEAMMMLYRCRTPKQVKANATTFIVDESTYPQTLSVLHSRSEALGITLKITTITESSLDESCFGAFFQYPNNNGNAQDLTQLISICQAKDIKTTVAADLYSLLLLKTPGEMGADIAVGNTQRFGVPMGFGGPHAAYFSTKEEYARKIPGRIIGVTIDKFKNKAYRMALQTREQHIRRDKATSNICTAQALLAIIASMYAVYHGPEGLKAFANRIHSLAKVLEHNLSKLGVEQVNDTYFDTLKIKFPSDSATYAKRLKPIAETKKLNLRYFSDHTIGIAIDELTEVSHIESIYHCFEELFGKSEPFEDIDPERVTRLGANKRSSNFLQQDIFNLYHSETEMLRYMKSLEDKDLSLTRSMIPLGSCTMKLNPTTTMIPITWNAFSNIHPFAPEDQTQGYLKIIGEFERDLATITGMEGVSLQPNSGAQGEYAGLLSIRNYFLAKGESQRNVVVIPTSAHGTNPASAAIAGFKIVPVKCGDDGDILLEDLDKQIEKHKDNLAAIMVTYPSTHGVFDETIQTICTKIHDAGGQVYMDGANMNAQVGLTSPGLIGADVCHLNLHKTFSIPHGGGGPGMGPICVKAHLVEHLPGHPVVELNAKNAAVSAAPWGSGSILLISYAYIKLLGKNGLKRATEIAILNANYIKSRIEDKFDVLFKGINGHVAHELIIDLRPFKKTAGVEVEDIAKRLMDYGFHAPTISWPVAGTMMIEPTESESQAELDRFCDALLSIYDEIKQIENGTYTTEDNPVKNSPHTLAEVTGDTWDHAYSRQVAAFPLEWVRGHKFWPSCSRLDQAHGDRNLVCTCGTVSEYADV